MTLGRQRGPSGRLLRAAARPARLHTLRDGVSPAVAPSAAQQDSSCLPSGQAIRNRIQKKKHTVSKCSGTATARASGPQRCPSSEHACLSVLQYILHPALVVRRSELGRTRHTGSPPASRNIHHLPPLSLRQ